MSVGVRILLAATSTQVSVAILAGGLVVLAAACIAMAVWAARRGDPRGALVAVLVAIPALPLVALAWSLVVFSR